LSVFIDLLVAGIAKLSNGASCAALLDRYGVRRTAKDFWQHSDKLIAAHDSAGPLANGRLDYNRLAKNCVIPAIFTIPGGP
jgi:hypothetical protein